MANEMIALQARAPDMPSFMDYVQIRDQAQNRQNAMVQMQQQQNAMLRKQAEEAAMNNAYGQAYDPATGRIDANKLGGLLAQGGFGSAIPGAQQELSKAQGEQSKSRQEQLKYLLGVNTAVRDQLGNANTPEDALARAQALVQSFPDIAPHMQQSLSTMPQDPAGFAQWKQDQLRENLSAEQQLKRHFQAQTTGDGLRVLSIPEYGAGPATVVPGSQGSLPPQTQFVWGANGGNIVDTRTAQATPVTAGGGSTGGGHAALATNPGALKDGPFARSQPGYAGAKGSFATFATPEQGIAAQEALIRSRYIGRGLNTVSKIIDTYAPVGPENSPASVANYKAYVARRAGIDPNAPIPPEKVSAVAAAQREFETGNRGGGQLQQAPTAAERAANGPGKPIPASVLNKGEAEFEIFSSLLRSNTTWNPQYAGNTITGGAETLAQRVFGEGVGTPGQAEWWADFRSTDNLIRNNMFGSALTDGEKAAYKATTIDETTDPKIAAQRLNKRGDIITGALRRKARTLVANGYNIDAVREMFGNEPMIVGDLDTVRSGAQPARPAAKPAANSGWGTAKVVGGR